MGSKANRGEVPLATITDVESRKEKRDRKIGGLLASDGEGGGQATHWIAWDGGELSKNIGDRIIGSWRSEFRSLRTRR